MRTVIDLTNEEKAYLLSAIHCEEVLSDSSAMAEHLRRKLKLEESEG